MIVRVGLLRRICVGDMWRHEDNPDPRNKNSVREVAAPHLGPHVIPRDRVAPLVEGYGPVEIYSREWTAAGELVLTGAAKELGKVGPVGEQPQEPATGRRGATR